MLVRVGKMLLAVKEKELTQIGSLMTDISSNTTLRYRQQIVESSVRTVSILYTMFIDFHSTSLIKLKPGTSCHEKYASENRYDPISINLAAVNTI